MTNPSIQGARCPPEGSARSPLFYKGTDVINGDVRQHRRYFTFDTDGGLAAGYAVSIVFNIGRRAEEIWPHFKDFNRWQNPYHYYSGVVGDLEGRSFRLSSGPNEPGPDQYRVLRVVPQHLIVIEQPGPWDGGWEAYDGYSVFTLHEHTRTTVVASIMQHSIRTTDMSGERALAYWKEKEPELQRKWRDLFIPNLKRLICGTNQEWD